MVQINEFNIDTKQEVKIDLQSKGQLDNILLIIENALHKGDLKEIEVKLPYYIGKGKFQTIEWYADKWYKSTNSGIIWELKYPDFPEVGFIKNRTEGVIQDEEI